MPHSFFNLTATPDHICITRAELAAEERRDYLDSLSPTEHEALMMEATPLANALYRTINDQVNTEAGISYGAIIEALHCVQARIDLEMNTPDPDECDA